MILRGSGFRRLGLWWLIAFAVLAGLVLFWLGDIRLGGQVMAAGFGAAALIRAVTSRFNAGGIAVRNKAVDVLILIAIALGVLIASATVKLDGDRVGQALGPVAHSSARSSGTVSLGPR